MTWPESLFFEPNSRPLPAFGGRKPFAAGITRDQLFAGRNQRESLLVRHRTTGTRGSSAIIVIYHSDQFGVQNRKRSRTSGRIIDGFGQRDRRRVSQPEVDERQRPQRATAPPRSASRMPAVRKSEGAGH